MKVAWDIDGTICLNPGPIPDWSKPGALAHTGESVNSYMPKFRALNYLNPEMEQVNREMIEYIITGRPANTIDPTITELQRYGVQVCRDNVFMFPNSREWSHKLNRAAKEICIRNGGFTHYVDNDPFLCSELRVACEKENYLLWAGSIAEFLALGIPGWGINSKTKILNVQNGSKYKMILTVAETGEQHLIRSRNTTKIEIPMNCKFKMSAVDFTDVITATITLRPQTTRVRVDMAHEIISVTKVTG